MSLFSWVIVLLYVVFIMIDYEKLARGFRRMVMPKYRRIVFKIGRDVKNSMNHYFRGQALVAFIVGILFSIGFLIIGLPMAIVLGMFIGLLNMVPYLQLISLVPATLICIVVSVSGGTPFWTLFWEMIAVYCIVQAIQDLILTPRNHRKSHESESRADFPVTLDMGHTFRLHRSYNSNSPYHPPAGVPTMNTSSDLTSADSVSASMETHLKCENY